MERRSLIISFFLVLICFCTSGAYVLKEYGWNWVTGTPKVVDYYVNENTDDCTGELGAIEDAMDTWNAVGTNFEFNYDGTTTVTNYYGENE